jgi:hypothetical protein
MELEANHHQSSSNSCCRSPSPNLIPFPRALQAPPAIPITIPIPILTFSSSTAPLIV